ncbi:MAG: thioredoxin family protein [Theionarchaea archaeon]|nr:thioredoxin family protein [Theionarchaea archaeon]
MTPMIIEIFGIERSKCKAMMECVGETLKDLDTEAQLVYISEPIAIQKRGVFITPALAINGDIKISGRVPSRDEITTLLQMD